MLRKALPFLVVALPCFGQAPYPVEPAVLYYVSLPLDGSGREREPVIGLALHGRKQAFRVDSRILNLDGGAVEAKWLIVGGVAAATAVLAARRDRTVEARREARPQPCPARPAC